MKVVNQSNFNEVVERKVEEIALSSAIITVSVLFITTFIVICYGAIYEVKITQNTLLAVITPITLISLLVRVYIGTVIKKRIEMSIASSIGYNEQQMIRVLRNPNYREHSQVKD